MKTIRSLFAQTFTAISSGDGAIGNLIECHMGCLINSSKKADLGFWELKSKKDERTGQLVTEVAMHEYPGVDKILEAAEKMYNFVNQGNAKK